MVFIVKKNKMKGVEVCSTPNCNKNGHILVDECHVFCKECFGLKYQKYIIELTRIKTEMFLKISKHFNKSKI